MAQDHSPGTGASPQRQGLIAGLRAAVSFGLGAPLISVVSVFSAEGSPLMLRALLYAGATLALVVVRSNPAGYPADRWCLSGMEDDQGAPNPQRADWHAHEHGHDSAGEGRFPL